MEIGAEKVQTGGFVQLRGRTWLVRNKAPTSSSGTLLSLACIEDDAQGETLDVLWEAELSATSLDQDLWAELGRSGAADPIVFGAYLRAVSWNTATAADRLLFQAPFRAGIRLEAYQLAPLRKALQLPRVNVLIADDTGVGKTIEAGLVLRELLLRRRADFMVVAAPPAMTVQWQEELESKFGLSFTIVDREHFATTRRLRGFQVNPWSTGSQFIVSHRLLIDETYAVGLRAVLGDLRPRSVLVLDEAHHAAPASGAKYAIDSQFTRALRDIAGRFEHRLFLSATPHNGHSNSFSSLLEILDPQRFTRGVPVRPRDLAPVMVRRLKSDLRRLDPSSFPERIVAPVIIEGLPADAPELVLAESLARYGALREQRIGRLGRRSAAQARIVFSGLQQRLLSSVAAFERTLRVHRETLNRLVEDGPSENPRISDSFAVAGDDQESDLLEDEAGVDLALETDDRAAGIATELGSVGSEASELLAELRAVEDMLALAEKSKSKSDARVKYLVERIASEFAPHGRWADRRLIIFTEWEDTRRWLQRRLQEAIADTDQAEDRIDIFTGATGLDRREEVKRRFNAPASIEPLRILICTDAAREGLNFQAQCNELIHFDLPWNPARLEQRNGRIDRKLQPAPKVYCRYFVYKQRPEDLVLDALVRKGNTIRDQLGSMGQVIEERIAARLSSGGILRADLEKLAKDISAADDSNLSVSAREELDDAAEARYARLLHDIDQLRGDLERSRKRVGVDPRELERVVSVALERSGTPLSKTHEPQLRSIDSFTLDDQSPVFTKDPSWARAIDDLRGRRRRRRESIAEWRRNVPVNAISFEPPVLADGRDAPGVVQVHLEHRLVRRLLARFLSQGFQADLDRVCAITGPGAQPRVVLLGRLVLFGSEAQRLHEEIIPVTALWTEADRETKPLRAHGDRGEDTTIAQLEDAIRTGRPAPDSALLRVRKLAIRDVADLTPELESRAQEIFEDAQKSLADLGAREADSLLKLLTEQAERIRGAQKKVKSEEEKAPLLALMEPAERRQVEAERRHWMQRLVRIEQEIESEPERMRRSYEVAAQRLEPVGLVYLWPASG